MTQLSSGPVRMSAGESVEGGAESKKPATFKRARLTLPNLDPNAPESFPGIEITYALADKTETSLKVVCRNRTDTTDYALAIPCRNGSSCGPTYPIRRR